MNKITITLYLTPDNPIMEIAAILESLEITFPGFKPSLRLSNNKKHEIKGLLPVAPKRKNTAIIQKLYY